MIDLCVEMVYKVLRGRSPKRSERSILIDTVGSRVSQRIVWGPCSNKGDSMMRGILGRTLNQFIMHAKDSSVMRYYDSHVDSTGKKKARITTMNKILDIIFAVLKRGTPYVYR